MAQKPPQKGYPEKKKRKNMNMRASYEYIEIHFFFVPVRIGEKKFQHA